MCETIEKIDRTPALLASLLMVLARMGRLIAQIDDLRGALSDTEERDGHAPT